VLACAGLERLGCGERITERIEPNQMLPAVAQGAIAVQARRGDSLAQDLSALDHDASARRVAAERSFLEKLGGDCSVPLAALAEYDEGALSVRGLVITPDGSRVVTAERSGVSEEAERMGAEVAEEVLRSGGAEILDSVRSGEDG